MRKHGFRIPVLPARVRSTEQAKAYAELKSVRVILKKCEARIPNTCFGCESAKHKAGESLCRVKKAKEVFGRSAKHGFRIPVLATRVRSTKQAKAYAEYNFIKNFERNSFCYKTL